MKIIQGIKSDFSKMRKIDIIVGLLCTMVFILFFVDKLIFGLFSIILVVVFVELKETIIGKEGGKLK